MIDETPLCVFYNCTKTKLLCDQLKEFISNTTLSIPFLMPQSAILGHIDLSDDYVLINHLISLFTNFNIEHLKAIINKFKNTEREISKHEHERRSKYLKK